MQAVMEALLAFLNHFPLFAIMLRFKDPDRLPGKLKILFSFILRTQTKILTLFITKEDYGSKRAIRTISPHTKHH